MKLKRNIVKIIRLTDDSDDGYVDNTHSVTFKMVWEITSDVWAFGGKNKVHFEMGVFGRVHAVRRNLKSSIYKI